MKNLFKRDMTKPREVDSYTSDANNIGYEVEQAFKIILDKWTEQGYSARDIVAIAFGSMHGMMCRKIIDVRNKIAEVKDYEI